MTETSNPFEIHVRRRRFVDTLPQRVDVLQAAFESGCDADTWKPELERLVELLRGLAGECREHALIMTEESATAAASLLERLASAGRAPGPSLRQKMRSYLDLLRQTAERAERYADDTELSFMMAVDAAGEPAPEEPRICLVSQDAAFAGDAVQLLGGFGYPARHYPPAQMQALAADGGRSLSGLVIDWDGLSVDDEQLVAFIHHLRAIRQQSLPVVFLSSCGDIDYRLRSVRAGGDGFFLKPVPLTRLVDRLDALFGQQLSNPYRVLIIDDSENQARHYAGILDKGGLLTHTLTDVRELIQALHEFHPDLILMDMYMPECSGRELARVIRQEEATDSTPIIFLSTEASIDRQLAAMKQLADGFIHKELDDAHLLEVVLTRAERSRTLRSFMQRDGLTGLLNHTSAKRCLENELQRARRYGHPMALAMIDIDHFKKVNDTYGHAAGDTVLKSLARLLQHRLRATDLVGRYGGEEFVVIMPETDGQTAAQILDRIRVSFGQIQHQVGQVEIQVHFSAGIAEFPLCETAAELGNAADTCLYEAKHAGRNRIVLLE